MTDLTSIIEGTSQETFETAGGFAFTDELAVRYDEKRRGRRGPVTVSTIDLAWLLDGYARARIGLPVALNTSYFHYAAIGFAVGVACTVAIVLILFAAGVFLIT